MEGSRGVVGLEPIDAALLDPPLVRRLVPLLDRAFDGALINRRHQSPSPKAAVYAVVVLCLERRQRDGDERQRQRCEHQQAP